MTALAVDAPVKTQPVDPNVGMTAGASKTFYAGSLLGLNTATGYPVNWADTTGYSFIGINAQKLTTDASGYDTTRPTQITGLVPGIVKLYPWYNRYAPSMTVAGVTAVTDHFKFVYCTTDNVADLTLTAPTDDRAPVGIVWRFRSTGVADVLFLNPMEAILLTMIGVYGEWVHAQASPSFSTGTTFPKVVQGIHGLITNIVAYTRVAGVVTASTFTLDGNVNGGTNFFAAPDVVALASVNAQGLVFTSDEAVLTANAEFHDGDTVNIIAANGGTAMTTWVGQFSVRFRRLLGV